MKYILIVLGFAVSVSFASAQTVRKANIYGTVVDSESGPLTGATVMLLAAKDSVLTSFAATDSEGMFLIKNAPADQYLLKVSYVGFETQTIPIEIGEQPELDLGTLNMIAASEVLSEIEVTSEHIPIQFKKDTIEYNADAYQTQPNAAVEDLLKKLPGVEVGQDGSIQAQGEDVQNVLVDGKEFFGTDPKVATKNLPAKSVKKVQVYDKMSDMAEFSGVDDGERQKTINLELKEEFKKGLFGTAEAGYGSDDRYLAKANINRFTRTSQLSFLGLFNNVNEQGFSFDEYVNFSGGMRSLARGSGGGGVRINVGESGVPISDGLGNGLTKTLAGGLNYNFEVGEKLDVRSSYFYNNVDNDLLQTTYRQNFLNGTTYETEKDAAQESGNHGHRFNLRAEYVLDSTQNLELVSRVSFGGGDLMSLETQETFNAEGILENKGLNTNSEVTDRVDYSTDLYYRNRLGQKRGRVLSTNLSIEGGDEDGDARIMAVNEYLTTGDTELLDQLQTSVLNNLEWGGEITYTEPITNKQFLEFAYEYSNGDESSVRDAFDVDSLGNETPSPDFSTHFQRDLIIHKPGLTWRLNTDRSTVSAGIEFQDTDLDGVVNHDEANVKTHEQHFLPSVRWRYNLSTSRNLRFDYRTSVNVPSVYQLSPIVENSDPLNIYVGNPNLNSEYAHRASIHFHSFSQFSFTSIFAMLTGTLTKNKIVNATAIDALFVETTTPVNIDDDLRLGAYASFGTPLRFLKTNLRLNGNVQYNNSLQPINGVDNNLNRWTRTFGVSFNSQNSDVIEYRIGGDWTQSTTRYSESTDRNQDFFTHHYYADATISFLKTWSIASSMDYTLYTGDQFVENQSLPIWKASLSKYIFEGRRGQIKLSVFDILDKNRGLSRTSNANYIEEVRTNSIGRYVMLSFVYSIQGFSQESRGGMGGMRIFRH